MNKLFVLVGVFILSGCGSSGSEIVWTCGNNIRLEANASGNRASVTIGGIEQPAVYVPEGIYSRWRFGEATENRRYPYTIRVSPDGDAGYYDFSEEEPGASIAPTAEFRCERESPDN
ncbi:MAG: hypothetical protein OXI11_07945 [Gammaproteobacteria bacterium]|nr:hypothetical protein [Gammaproteobacteria bacterium]